MAKWNKQGLVLAPPLDLPWSSSHVALPTIDLSGRILYFATRDAQGRSWIARSELDIDCGHLRAGRLDPAPVLAPGPLGAFDDAGVTPSCLVSVGEDKWLYYTGWSLGVSVPFYLAIGLAISSRGGRFERVSQGPILGRTRTDPYLTASPHVLREGSGWRMWYVSGERWTRAGLDVRHHYHLRHGRSEDGIDWRTDGRACIGFADRQEYAFSRPCVLESDRGYEMWFSVRGDAYRLGYAHSTDGAVWERDDRAAGLDPSQSGWDAEMIAYPHVFDAGDTRYMLYNGNGYGASGIGAAVADGA